jgi:hypothetical protein
MCHVCIESEEGKKKNDKRANNSSPPPPIDQCDAIGVASESDVSPNTPRADGT